jgi:hypothetical protein
MNKIVLMASACLALLAACTPETPAQRAAESAAEAAQAVSDQAASAAQAAADQAAAAAVHNYTARDGFAYSYVAPFSDEAKNAGVNTGKVFTYRYLGERNGVYTLDTNDMSGLLLTCTNPCTVLIMIDANDGSIINKADFDPQSIEGLAFTDAFNGQLEVYKN